MPPISPYLLRQIRNKIPIVPFIRDFLTLPWKISENYFRFLCPVCHEFRTACNQKTNLARCFLCQKNFNTIDILIISHNISFLQAVEILKPLLSRF